MTETKIEEMTVCEDRISELPDDLLVMILRFVPTKDVVATMILSRRWFSIWTMVNTLKYKDSRKEDDDDDESKKSVWWFLDKSLQSHKAHVIDSLCMKLGPRCPTDADVGKWVANAVDRRVVSLIVKLFWSADPTSLPMSLYTCETLKELTLSHKILVDFPSSSSYCLPSLFKLRIAYVVYKDEASLVRFLSSCPILQSLFVQRKKDDNVKKFSVKVPSLRQFHYLYRPLPYESDVVDTNRCLVIDTPKLKIFSIADDSGDSCSVMNMAYLNSASIDVRSSLDSEMFIRSLSKVLSLQLFFTKEVIESCSTINFSRLKMLKVCPHDIDWLKILMLLLGNAPKVKKLIVHCGYIYEPEDDLPFSWNQPSSVPKCLSSQLEILECIEYGDSIEEEEFLTYVFANSKCLKTAIISLRSTVDILEEQDLIFEKLKDIPRLSEASQLLFK